MDALRDLLPSGEGHPAARVVVLTGPDAPPADLLAVLGADLSGTASVEVVDATVDPGLLHIRLAARAPLDLVADAGGDDALGRLADLVGHVRTGGAYVCVLDGGPVPTAITDWVHRLAALRAELASGAVDLPGRKAKKRRDLATLALSVRVRLAGRLLVAVHETDLLAKLHDRSMDEVLRDRGGPDRVLTSVAAATVESRAVVRASRPPPLNDLPASYAAPRLSLREYHHAVCLPRQAAHAATFVLSESFRDNLQPRLQNPAFEDWTARFVRRPEPPATELPGSWFHLDTHVAGHFGHALTEQVSHLWGWHEARRLDPSVGALIYAAPESPGAPLPAWTAALLEAGGVPRDSIHVADAPVRVERLLACTAAYNIGRYVHPVMAQEWARIGAALGGDVDGGAGPERVFLTRSGDKRACRNRAEVEDLFAAAGFEVVSPEHLPLGDQVRLVREASVVAGFAGSAMFHTALAARPQHVVVITSETYPAHNEYAIAALLGHRLDLVVCPPDVPRREPDRFTLESFHSDFAVDLGGREGEFVRSVLAGL